MPVLSLYDVLGWEVIQFTTVENVTSTTTNSRRITPVTLWEPRTLYRLTQSL